MKDYRQYSKPYTFDEWETNKEWLAHRLDFLWTYSDYYINDYLEKCFGDEKELLYAYYGTDNEIGKMASEFHYGQYKNSIYKFELKDCYKIFDEYYKLEVFRVSHKDDFLRKRIYIKYYFVKEFMLDNELFYDYKRYLHDFGYQI